MGESALTWKGQWVSKINDPVELREALDYNQWCLQYRLITDEECKRREKILLDRLDALGEGMKA